MNAFSSLNRGHRFRPTEEELVNNYLRKKVASERIEDVIQEVDRNKIEPWDLEELCRIESYEKSEFSYFFSHKDRDKKYTSDKRTNRATTAGFWKVSGRDKAIYSNKILIGMRKCLVFYIGRAPNGQKSDWIMHEYRLETSQAEGWVVCKVFKKKTRKERDQESLPTYDNQAPLMPDFSPPQQMPGPSNSYQLEEINDQVNVDAMINELLYQGLTDDEVRVMDEVVADQVAQDGAATGKR